MKKISLFFTTLLMVFVSVNTLDAKTIEVASTDDLSAKIGEAEEGDTLVLEDGTYTGNITIDKALTIEGSSKEDTIIVGQITVTDNFDMKNVTVIGEYVNDTYKNVVAITTPELIVNFDNVNLNVKDYVADKDYKTRVSGIIVDADANGTKLTVTNSKVNATYGIYVKSEKNTVPYGKNGFSGERGASGGCQRNRSRRHLWILYRIIYGCRICSSQWKEITPSDHDTNSIRTGSEMAFDRICAGFFVAQTEAFSEPSHFGTDVRKRLCNCDRRAQRKRSGSISGTGNRR